MKIAFEVEPIRNRGRRTVYPYSVAADRLAMVGATRYRGRFDPKSREMGGSRGQSIAAIFRLALRAVLDRHRDGLHHAERLGPLIGINKSVALYVRPVIIIGPSARGGPRLVKN